MKKISLTFLSILTILLCNNAYSQQADSLKQAKIKYISSVNDSKAQEEVVLILDQYKEAAKVLIDEKNSKPGKIQTEQQLEKMVPTTERRKGKTPMTAGATSYEWYDDGYFMGTTNEPMLRALTPSGWTDQAYTNYEGLCQSYYSYSVYPNPTSNELTVTSKEEDVTSKQSNTGNARKPSKDKSFEIKLYDEKGKALRTYRNEKGNTSVVMNTMDIPNGTYYLHITEGKEVSKKQIIIQH